MEQLNHRNYYAARAESARYLAGHAASPGIAAIHAEMVEHYEAILTHIDQDEQPTVASVPGSRPRSSI